MMANQHRFFYQGDNAYIDFTGTNFYLRQSQPSFVGINKQAILLNSSGNTTFPGILTASRVNNAYYNDIAEFFPRGEETEPGDIIGLDMYSLGEKYIKASSSNTSVVVGVHSDTFGYILGGEKYENENEDIIAKNMYNYIPVGLAGRVKVKFIGKAKKGMRVVPSIIPGVGCELNLEDGNNITTNIESYYNVVGILLESDDISDTTTIRRLNMLIRSF